MTGTLRSCDPDRVVLKKIVLSGYPVKVHKKKAVVRWMFHNPEDVRWFKPLELWTKYGRRGRIKVTPGFESVTLPNDCCEMSAQPPPQHDVTCALSVLLLLVLQSAVACKLTSWQQPCTMFNDRLCCQNNYHVDTMLSIALQEPIGTHGAMKCMFDGVVQQRDAVCASLFKRSYPVWPGSLDFCQ